MRDETVQLESFIDSLGAACLVLNEGGSVVAANHRAEDLYAAGRDDIVGRRVGDLCADSDRCLVECTIGSCNGSTKEFTARARRADGTSFLGEFTATRHHLGSQGEDLLVLIIRELEESLSACKEDLELHHLLLENSLDGIVAHTIEGELLFANRAAEEQWGYSAEEARARGPWGWVADQSRQQVSARIAQMLDCGQARFESYRVMDDGRAMHQEVHARIVESSHGKIVVSSTRDISERVEAEEMMRHLAYHDMLTGLGNRAHLDRALRLAVSSADRHGDIVGVVFIDLDDFKPINDTYGHLEGDNVLREVARRLKTCVREYDTVARMGGDEFVVVLPRLPEPGALMAVASKLVQEVSKPIAIGEASVIVEPSIGIAVHRCGEDAESLLTRADLHMYEVRDRKKDVVLQPH
ncbi:MAG TPA: diguanylate cyclase [Coriobacteriia bacterium]|nr:diguanylate cyclase [Coriobacteriia bacterium]